MANYRENFCSRGKPCLASCINKNYLCKVYLPSEPSILAKMSKTLSERGSDIADHLGKNIAAWKAGKVFGQSLSAYLESVYGIPREISSKLSETAIQAIVATGLDAAHTKSADQFLKKFITEMAAAYIGKTSHVGVETIVSSKDISTVLESALPALAGKFSGLSVSIAANRLPSPGEVVNAVRKRSESDIKLLQGFVGRVSENFAESSKVESIVGDLLLLTLLLVKGKNKIELREQA